MSTDAVPPQPAGRFPTGVPGLDTILRGGFLQGGIYLIMGAPGTGKTVLGNQIAFGSVQRGEQAIYLTLLAERHSRMIIHLRSMSFFDSTVVGEALHYFSGYRELEEGGLDALLNLLGRTIRERRASLLIIDGLSTVEAFAESPLVFKRFLHELHTLVDMLECTALLLTDINSNRPHPEHAIVDGIIHLDRRRAGLRAVRELEVLKLRGVAHLEGTHVFEITGDGITVFPRTEALYGTHPVPPPQQAGHVPTGVRRLDEMLEGGLLAGSTTMVLGASGSGKTCLGLSFLGQGAQQGEAGLYFGFYESPERLVAKADHLGLGFGQIVTQGTIEIIWHPAAEQPLDALAAQIMEAVERKQVRRLFLDGINAFEQIAVYPNRLGRFLAALTSALRSRGVTTVFAAETQALFGAAIEPPAGVVSAIAENIIFLRYVELHSRIYRLISVLKCRESGFDPSIRELRIAAGGLEVGETFENAEALLTGTAREAPPSDRNA